MQNHNATANGTIAVGDTKWIFENLQSSNSKAALLALTFAL